MLCIDLLLNSTTISSSGLISGFGFLICRQFADARTATTGLVGPPHHTRFMCDIFFCVCISHPLWKRDTLSYLFASRMIHKLQFYRMSKIRYIYRMIFGIFLHNPLRKAHHRSGSPGRGLRCVCCCCVFTCIECVYHTSIGKVECT